MGEPSSTGAPSSVATAASSVRAGFSKKRAGLSKKLRLMVKIIPRVAPHLEVKGAVGRSRDTPKTPWGGGRPKPWRERRVSSPPEDSEPNQISQISFN